MKRNRRNDEYGLSKRRANQTYPTYNGSPYRQQNNQQSNVPFLAVTHRAAQDQMTFRSSASNSFIYNMSNGWPMSPPMQYSMAPYIHQTHPQFLHTNVGPPYPNQTNLMPYSNVSVPPPLNPSNVQNGNQQTSNNTLGRARPQNDTPKRKWCREDAIKALAVEEELCKRNTTAPYLVIRFPDPPLDTEMVKRFSKEIDAVHFQKNSAPRFCFVRLKDNTDAAKVIKDISTIPFGMGHLSAELRFDPTKPPPATKPEQVDPYTLYVGNLSLSVSVETIKRHFPGALRYDLAFKSKIKPIRYAFIRFDSIEKATEAFKHGMNLQVDGRSLVLRFRRAKFNYPAEKTSLGTVQSNNISTAHVTDLTAENDGNIITNIAQITERNNSPSNEITIKNENCKGENMFDAIEHIKEEQYDTDYSYEDECCSSYCGHPYTDLDQSDIKSESNDCEPCNSDCIRLTEDFDDGKYADKNKQCSKSFPANSVNKCRRVESHDKSVNYVKAQVLNTTTVKENLKMPGTTRTLSENVSISEKKYIENLYDQLNSSRVLKKEVHSEFDELEEMLKEVD
ncbi:PREDICTED: uncharacterized protein LOC108367884 isoform X2 [Rhagoletis zephyria]|uniref:uncharacterized protein LOC108367884 isoform X2 n=1 Tax=Rhagoletis zephyria TaxID=28612 RepID=UPI000811251B|nr:PREDICTED: uncharacterized protein LOC108367884 isoform X2 [Rhagoletis zephyria]